jgi:hypothetical protein
MAINKYFKNTHSLLGCRKMCKVCSVEARRFARSKKDDEEDVGVAAVEADTEEYDDDDDDDEKTKDEDGDEGSSSMTAADRTREATRRNRVRREANGEGQGASSKWCSTCLQDLALDAFYKSKSKIFGRQGQCRACRPN